MSDLATQNTDSLQMVYSPTNTNYNRYKVYTVSARIGQPVHVRVSYLHTELAMRFGKAWCKRRGVKFFSFGLMKIVY